MEQLEMERNIYKNITSDFSNIQKFGYGNIF